MEKIECKQALTWLLDIKNYIQNIQGEWQEKDERAYKTIFTLLQKEGR